jgi:hypothetical protein
MNGYVATNEAISIVGCDLQLCSSATAMALLRLGFVEVFENEIIRFLPNLGIEATESQSGLISSVHLHSNGHEGFAEFPFEFRGLSFSSSRKDVVEVFGEPLHLALVLRAYGTSSRWVSERCTFFLDQKKRLC